MFNSSGLITILKKLPIHLDNYIIITIDNITLLITIIPLNSIRDKTSSESLSSPFISFRSFSFLKLLWECSPTVVGNSLHRYWGADLLQILVKCLNTNLLLFKRYIHSLGLGCTKFDQPLVSPGLNFTPLNFVVTKHCKLYDENETQLR